MHCSPRALSPRGCLVSDWPLGNLSKGSLAFCYNITVTGWRARTVLDGFSSFFRLGWSGGTPVIYDASTRPVVVDSIRRGPYKQPIQVSERGQYWHSRRNARLNDVCGGWEQQLGPHQWTGR
jgi:hypothetical protein